MGTTPILNLPFVDPTDLVRDFPGDDEAQMLAVEAAIDGIPVLAGIGSNVVQTVKTDTFTTSSTAFVDLMSLTITPSTDTSKVLIMYSVNFGNTSGDRAGLGVITDGANTVLVQADAAGSRRQATFGSRNTAANVDSLLNHSGFFLWSPGADTAQTIKIRVAANGNTLTVNRSGFDSDDGAEVRVLSSLTAIEVAA